MKWPAVEQLFAAALGLPPSERARLLTLESDAEVRNEVSRLLALHDDLATAPDADRFLTSLPLDLTAALVDADATDPGSVGRFRVIRRLGHGASGVVYLAHDPELDRAVALKLLPKSIGQSTRWSEEARAASALQHPNVVTIYDTGRTEGGQPFIAMAYEEGETLRHRIARGSIPTVEALAIAKDIAAGLTAAHAKGIVHRDLKPENVLLTARGALLIDFGIATVQGSPGKGGGTPAYMSPEQLRGEGVDHRTDLWALGVVMHEMLAGARPFPGDNREAVTAAILHATAPPVPGRLGVGQAVTRMLQQCLEKDPDRRPASAAAIVEILEGDAPRAHPKRRTVLAGTGIAAALLATAAWQVAWGGRNRPTADAPGGSAPGVAVMPYRTVGAEVAYLGEGMVDLLSYTIEGVPGLRKIDPVAVISRWHRDRDAPASDIPSPDDALAIARDLAAAYLVSGSVVQLGEEVRLIAEVRETTGGRVRGAAQVTGPLDSIATLVDRLTVEMLRQNLLPFDGDRSPFSLRASTTSSLAALKAYLAGEKEFRTANWRGAARHYATAIALDSTFGRAIYRSIKVIDWGDRAGDRDRLLGLLAPLVSRLPERDRLLVLGDMGNRLGVAEEIDWGRQISLLEELVRRFPDDVEGWATLGERQFHDAGVLLQPGETFRPALERAVALNPHYVEPYLHLIDDAFYRLDSATAGRLVAEVRSLEEDNPPCTSRFEYDLVWGTPAARQEAFEALDRIPHPALWTTCITRHAPYPAPRAVRDKLSRIYLGIADTSRRPNDLSVVFLALLFKPRFVRGEVRPLREELARLEGRTANGGWWAERWSLLLHFTIAPDADAALRAARHLGETTIPTVKIWEGLLAVTEHRWADAVRVEEWLATWAARYPNQAVGALATSGERHRAALRAVRRLVAGEETSLQPLEEALRHLDRLSANDLPAMIRYLVGKHLLDDGRLADAERYFRSFGAFDVLGVLAGFHLAQVAERSGRAEEALERYQSYLKWWDGSPEERPAPVREAERAVERLTRGVATTVTPR